MMESADSVLTAMGIDPEAARAVDRAQRRGRRVRDNRVCICGHGMSRHSDVNGATFCKPSALTCECKAARPVLEADDTRYFLRRTNGPGTAHALVRGIAASGERGVRVRWIEQPTCDRCGSAEGGILPAPVMRAGGRINPSGDSTGYDKFLCPTCIGELV
jgi:hypothetical protein